MTISWVIRACSWSHTWARRWSVAVVLASSRDDIAELTRVFVDARARGNGVGASVVEFVEESVRRSRRKTMRLDTRADLVEARGLYSKLGYREVPAFNAEPYAEVWLEKRLL
ncbi:MAG: GNAT family N-acetyltransferase [Rhodococcus sp.]|uniref:GNAT family N-acetyltransferase n=1 Tax=Rhodococcoides fascians TaxID=1828 RepID=UPI00068A7261|nr:MULTISPECIES: GNAT family N-acetyltransferase [Rhodococcus]MCX6489950.1 GNAT family N-acetyltransferase [Rhodococcus sp. (in: high G+C Gram-positive bacteria)]WQH28295.1 GNAT family N-acetyltransferase [Rhodococcus fascians]